VSALALKCEDVLPKIIGQLGYREGRAGWHHSCTYIQPRVRLHKHSKLPAAVISASGSFSCVIFPSAGQAGCRAGISCIRGCRFLIAPPVLDFRKRSRAGAIDDRPSRSATEWSVTRRAAPQRLIHLFRRRTRRRDPVRRSCSLGLPHLKASV
jgi:hypothetical protein